MHTFAPVQTTDRSVASCRISVAFRLSVLVAADLLVNGVLTELPPLTEPEGVVVDVISETSVTTKIFPRPLAFKFKLPNLTHPF